MAFPPTFFNFAVNRGKITDKWADICYYSANNEKSGEMT